MTLLVDTSGRMLLVGGLPARIVPPAGWSITNNEDGSFTITAAPDAPPALTVTNNADGTFTVAA